jgi:hypothetical protein
VSEFFYDEDIHIAGMTYESCEKAKSDLETDDGANWTVTRMVNDHLTCVQWKWTFDLKTLQLHPESGYPSVPLANRKRRIMNLPLPYCSARKLTNWPLGI